MNPTDPAVVQGSGTLSFDASGFLTAVTGSPVTFEFSGGGAAGQVANLDFGPLGGATTGAITTQFAGTGDDSVANSTSQDGFGTGTLQTLTVDREGFFVASYSNGVTQPLAQVALANFANLGGLN